MESVGQYFDMNLFIVNLHMHIGFPNVSF
jgi:hypothetical protein